MNRITIIKIVEAVPEHLYETAREWINSEGVEESKRAICMFVMENIVDSSEISSSKTTVDIVLEEDVQ